MSLTVNKTKSFKCNDINKSCILLSDILNHNILIRSKAEI